MPDRVLVVEDEDTLRRNLARYLEQQGYQVVAVASAEDGLVATEQGPFDVAVLDVRLTGKDGLSLAAELAERSPDTMVVMMTAYGSVDSVVEALHAGVHDYLIKPLLLKDVAAKLKRLCEHRRLVGENARLRRALAQQAGPGGPVARSQVMLDLIAFARQVANSSTTVLIEGESGCGKEVFARLVHDASPRADGPFLAVNMTAVPEALIESTLFGHERGAFTSADQSREGLFRAAAGGTLLLDEIGDMPLPLQAKLLRVLESKEVVPVGGTKPTKVDTRILAATNADLPKLVQERRFRGDLYYRLSAIRLRLPPLRERPEDVPVLVQHFLQRHCHEHHRAVSGVDSAAMRRLLTYTWPGNVREISNVIERAVVVAQGDVVTTADLPPEINGACLGGERTYDDAMADFERALLRSTLERVRGDRREAAKLLDVSVATLYRRVEKLGLKEPKAGADPEGELAAG